ncbi:Radical SAM superfamily protein [Aquisphaera giovannonii]|uniref:Radical SAM superfamily protein n=1 Tax=Aquisphaera giovannonii TaxID=406548 RepID=A0A5B9W4E9_9BACT|nr:PA0069 family radical SAM protein [Aquisphaera giovannonii]QEH34941.1 Radical SAM superfamily protein [Aquisphaera giovannonii]
MTRDDHPLAAGRGARVNTPNRFERTHHELDLSELDAADDADYIASLGRPPTEFLPDRSRTVVCRNDSPDVGFEASINPYRGCEHGCSYCYARPGHEYLGYSAGLDFETRILVKHDAPELLRRELMKPGYEPKVLAISGVTDPYQPAERRLRLTRRCLEVLAEFRHPVGIVTKNRLVVRDLDLLAPLAAQGASGVMLSITTLDAGLARELEPRTSPPAARLEAIRALAAAGVPAGVMVAPVIPGLTDHEMPAILEAAAAAGARVAGYVMLRLPLAVAPLFEDWLDKHRPAVKDRVLGRIRALRGGRLNDARFGVRLLGEGPLADVIRQVFHVACRQHGLNRERWPVSPSAFRRPEPSGPGRQLRLFE